MDDETVTLPPTAVEREVDGLTQEMGGPYMDVDAELFLSAHGLPQNTRRKRTVRLLERLFAPPVGTINVEEARFLSALDLGRREREMISAARAEEGDRLRERGVARGWSRRSLWAQFFSAIPRASAAGADDAWPSEIDPPS